MTDITKRAVDALAEGRYLWDGRFGVRATSSGKSYLIQYRIGRRSRRYTIGRHGQPWSPDTAGKEAARLLLLVDSGTDPMEKKVDARTVPLLRDVVERFMKEHAATKLKPRTARLYRLLCDGLIVPALGARAITTISRADVAALHHRHRATPVHANRMLLLVSKLMNYAERIGLRPDGSNPVRHVQRYREQKRQRFLSIEEFQRLGHALDELPETTSPFVKSAIALLALTGCRRSEILGLEWRDVDLARGVLTLREAKTGPRVVYLNSAAVRVLEALPRVEDNPFVIVGGRAGQHRVNLTKAWDAVRKSAKLPDVRLHDLRHAFASVGAADGLSLPKIGALLGHSQPQTTARYAHLAASPLHEATERIGSVIEKALMGGRTQI